MQTQRILGFPAVGHSSRKIPRLLSKPGSPQGAVLPHKQEALSSTEAQLRYPSHALAIFPEQESCRSRSGISSSPSAIRTEERVLVSVPFLCRGGRSDWKLLEHILGGVRAGCWKGTANVSNSSLSRDSTVKELLELISWG